MRQPRPALMNVGLGFGLVSGLGWCLGLGYVVGLKAGPKGFRFGLGSLAPNLWAGLGLWVWV